LVANEEEDTVSTHSTEKPVLDARATGAAIDAQVNAQYAIRFANRELVRFAPTDRRYVEHLATLEGAMLNLAIGKWHLGMALGTHDGFAEITRDPADVAIAHARLTDAGATASWVLASLQAGERLAPPTPTVHVPSVRRHGEIEFSDDVPLVPTICPIVVLQGSSFEMGHQYITQVVEIYGTWIFEHLAGRTHSVEQTAEIHAWEEQLLRFTPEIVEMARGMEKGAQEAGIPMSYEHALAIWTGADGPTQRVLGVGEHLWDPRLDVSRTFYLASYTAAADRELCSGCCAWGNSTIDGRLIVGATTDHDCTFQATVIAFPDDGNNFIYTPFSANGNVPGFGELFMAGHPGINSSGVAYIHHGGVPYVGEPTDEWGYGVRRGAGTFHHLRYSNSARDALETQLAWPVGDAGRAMGTDGGFYADRSYGYVLESRASVDGRGPVVRERSFGPDGSSYDFLYSNNNALSERSPRSHAVPQGGDAYDPVAGWYSRAQQELVVGSPGESWRMVCAKTSETRNRYHFEKLRDGYGAIDADYMYRLHATGGTLPQGSWDEITARYADNGQWEGSIAHRGNAFVTIADLDAATYTGCVGPLRRGLETNAPGHGFYYYDETNTSWELTLAGSPGETVRIAAERAREDVERAKRDLDGARIDERASESLQARLTLARQRLDVGERLLAETAPSDTRAAAAQHGRALRELTRAQVRARQVSEAISPLSFL
jgi:hypothetical protein